MSARNERNAASLQSSGGVRRAGIAAGLVVLLLVAGMFVTSLVRAPNPVWSVVLAVLGAGLTVALLTCLLRRRRAGG